MRKEAEVRKLKPKVGLRHRREVLSREEELRRFRQIDDWRRAHFEQFKKTHAKVRNPH